MRAFITALLIQKRLLKKPGFWIVLLMIPLLVLSILTLSQKDTGALTVGVCVPENSDEAVQTALVLLEKNGDFMRYVMYSDSDRATADLNSRKLDCVWIFPADLKDKIVAHLAGDRDAEKLVTILQKEESIPAQLSREVLFGAVFPAVSKQIYKNYVTGDLALESRYTDEELDAFYGNYYSDLELVRYVNTGGDVVATPDFLLLPVRGILSIIIMVSSFAATMYYQNDFINGVYATMPRKRQVFILLASAFFGALDCAAVAFISLMFTPVFAGVWQELLPLLAFSVAVGAFCAFFAALIRKPYVMGAWIVFVSLAVLVATPVFFNIDGKIVSKLLPQSYYLDAIGNGKMLLWLLGLGAGYGILTLLVFKLRPNIDR